MGKARRSQVNKQRKSPVKIVKFRTEDADKLAELFNSFDRGDLWPVRSSVQLQPKEDCRLEDYLILTNGDYAFMDKLAAILREES
jgi:hypothetical protein